MPYAISDVSDRTARSCTSVAYVAVSYFVQGLITLVKLSIYLSYYFILNNFTGSCEQV